MSNILKYGEIIFLRKSRSDNSKETVEETLQKHEQQLQEYALREFGYKIPESNIYREVVSGGEDLQSRPVFQQVLKRIEDKNITRLLVIDTARISRRGIYGAGEIINLIRFSNVLLCTLGRTYDLNDEFDRKFIEMELLNSNQYLEYTKQILNRGREHSISLGNYIGSTAPFGYDKYKLKDEKGFSLKFNKDSETVKIIFEMLIDGIGTSNIANHLNTTDAKPLKSDEWTPQIIRNILTNITYAGMLTYGKRKTVNTLSNGRVIQTRPNNENPKIFKGKHDPIVSIEDFNNAQKILHSHNNSKVPKNREIQNPLAGIIQCSCGRNMVRRPYSMIFNKHPRRKYEIDKLELQKLLRDHKDKAKLSHTQIANCLDITKDTVIGWFNKNINKLYFSDVFTEKWYELKKLLHIKTNKYDKIITTYEDPKAHEDTLICNLSSCNTVSSNLKEVEHGLIIKLEAYLNEYKYFLDNYEEEVEKLVLGNTNKIKSIDKNIEKLKKRKKNALINYNDEKISYEEYSELKHDIDEELGSLEIEKSKIVAVKEEDKIIRYKKAIPVLSLCVSRYYSLNTNDRNELLKSIIDKAIYRKTERSTKNKKVNFDLEVHLKK